MLEGRTMNGERTPGTDTSASPRSAGARFQMAPRLFRLAIVGTVMIGIGLFVVAYLSPIFLIVAAIAVAAIADGLEPLAVDVRWLGWQRRVDRTRVLLFLGWFVVALVGLAAFRLVIEHQIVLCC